MRFTTIQNYIEALEDVKVRFRGDCKIKPIRDDDKQLVYKVSRGVVGFACEGNLSLYVFLNEQGFARFIAKNPKVDLLANKLFVSVGKDDGFWADVVVCGRCEEISTPIKDEIIGRVYSEGLKAHCVNDKWGFVNSKGEIVIDCVWDRVEDFSENRCLVERDGLFGLIDMQGKIVVEPIYDELSWDGSNYLYGEKEGIWGVLNRGGDVVVAFEWDWVGEFNYGFAIVCKNSKSGFVNTKGELVIPVKYDEATSFNEYKIASVVIDEKQFFIDTLDRHV